MNKIAVHAPTLPGLLPNVEALRLAQSFHAMLEGHEVLVDRLPTAVERQQLSARADALAVALRPIGESSDDRGGASVAIAAMLVGYGAGRKDKAAAETVAVYLEHLGGIPLFAVRAACDDVKCGRVYDVEKRTGNRIPLDPDFPPSTVRLRSVAQKHVDELAIEKWRFDRLLRAKRIIAPPISEAERARMAENFKGLQRDMASRSAATELEEAERKARLADEARARNEQTIVAEYAALGLEPVRNGGILCSLSMMKSAGWHVEEVNFGGEIRRSLVSPAAAQ